MQGELNVLVKCSYREETAMCLLGCLDIVKPIIIQVRMFPVRPVKSLDL